LAAIDIADQALARDGEISRQDAEKVAVEVKQQHPVFTSIIIVDGKKRWDYQYVASPVGIKQGPDKLVTFEVVEATMLIRLTPKHTIGSLAAEPRCRHARRCPAPRGSALSGFTARVPTPLS
jgi:hypothetical protein